MSKNPLYANEVATAHQFVIEHNTDIELMNFLRQVQNDIDRSHSSHWSKIYDYIMEKYPEYSTGGLITGLSYYIEN